MEALFIFGLGFRSTFGGHCCTIIAQNPHCCLMEQSPSSALPSLPVTKMLMAQELYAVLKIMTHTWQQDLEPVRKKYDHVQCVLVHGTEMILFSFECHDVWGLKSARVKLLLRSFWLCVYSFETHLRVVDIDILYLFILLEARIIILCCNHTETKILLLFVWCCHDYSAHSKDFIFFFFEKRTLNK